MAEQKEWGELQQGAAQIGERGGKSSEGDEGPGSGRGRRQRPRAEAKTRDDNDMGSPPPKAKAGGWGEDSAPAETGSDQPGSRRRFSLSRNRSKGDSRSSEGVSEATPDGFSSSQRKFSDDSVGDEDDDAAADEDDDDVIMIIPDLDDEQEEDMAFVVAEAPKNVRQVQSLQELNKNIQGLELPTDPAQERVDVSLLSSVLAPRELLDEPDDHWEFETLLEELSQAMTTDKESHEEMEKMMVGSSSTKGTTSASATATPTRAATTTSQDASQVNNVAPAAATTRVSRGRRQVSEAKA